MGRTPQMMGGGKANMSDITGAQLEQGRKTLRAMPEPKPKPLVLSQATQRVPIFDTRHPLLSMHGNRQTKPAYRSLFSDDEDDDGWGDSLFGIPTTPTPPSASATFGASCARGDADDEALVSSITCSSCYALAEGLVESRCCSRIFCASCAEEARNRDCIFCEAKVNLVANAGAARIVDAIRDSLPSCPTCSAVFHPAMEASHASYCTATAECPQGCGSIVLARAVDRHVSSNCPRAPASCRFGCEITRAEAPLHDATHVREHNEMLLERLDRMESRLVESEVRVGFVQDKVVDMTQALADVTSDHYQLRYEGRSIRAKVRQWSFGLGCLLGALVLLATVSWMAPSGWLLVVAATCLVAGAAGYGHYSANRCGSLLSLAVQHLGMCVLAYVCGGTFGFCKAFVIAHAGLHLLRDVIVRVVDVVVYVVVSHRSQAIVFGILAVAFLW